MRIFAAGLVVLVFEILALDKYNLHKKFEFKLKFLFREATTDIFIVVQPLRTIVFPS